MNEVQQLKQKRLQLYLGGGNDKIEAQHFKGKLTARERLEYLFDHGTFLELYAYMRSDAAAGDSGHGDGVITGFGMVGGRKVFVFAQDFTYMGGSLGEKHAKKIAHTIEKASQVGCPVIGLFDSGGARIQEGINSLAGFGSIFRQNTAASGRIPQIAAVMGPCAGGSVYTPALMDFVFMVEDSSQMFLTGPQVIATVTGEKISVEELGGAKTHTSVSGVAHARFTGDKPCLDGIKRLLTYLPGNAWSSPPKEFISRNIHDPVEKLKNIIPGNAGKAYNMYEIINGVIDEGSMFELHADYARNIITALTRINGRPVGVVANQPLVLAGCLDIASAQKVARFVRTCDMLQIPLVTLVDTPGFLPGSAQEFGGVIRHGSAMLYAYSEATVPRVTVVLRKAYGGAYIAMCCRELGADAVFAWPNAEIAVMGPEGAANIVYKQAIQSAENPEEMRREKVEEYRENFANPYCAASSGHIDDVIAPEETRERIVISLMMGECENGGKRQNDRKHGNIPL